MPAVRRSFRLRFRGLGDSSSGSIPQLIANAASAAGVPANLALEVGIQESGLNQNEVSSKGAIGVMQLLPSTAADLGVNPYDLQQNITGGVRYLAQMLSEFGGDQAKALAGYNWGAENVQTAISAAAQAGDDWLSHAPSSVQNYVKSILSAIGQNYSATITAGSVAAGVANAAGSSSSPGLAIGLAIAALAFLVFVATGDDDDD